MTEASCPKIMVKCHSILGGLVKKGDSPSWCHRTEDSSVRFRSSGPLLLSEPLLAVWIRNLFFFGKDYTPSLSLDSLRRNQARSYWLSCGTDWMSDSIAFRGKRAVSALELTRSGIKFFDKGISLGFLQWGRAGYFSSTIEWAWEPKRKGRRDSISR